MSRRLKYRPRTKVTLHGEGTRVSKMPTAMQARMRPLSDEEIKARVLYRKGL
jgi:hypothetical protein